MIKPTVGRVVWFWPNPAIEVVDQPMAATIAFVHGDRSVNLSVVDHNGQQSGRHHILLLQGDEVYKPMGAYCEWMPYQVGQAKKDEATHDASLQAELSRGATAAKAVCEHLVSMGAGGGQIPVKLDGRDYVVSVYPSIPGDAPVGTVKPPMPFPSENPVADAMAIVTQAMREDDGYLVGWHANIAMAAIDAGCPRDVAQETGARFLHILADVDVRQRPWFQRVARVAKEVETKTYPDGTTATGTAPLPEQSPTADAIEWVAVRRPVKIGSGLLVDDVWIRCKVTRVHGGGRVVDIVNPDGTREALELGANCRAVSAPEPDQSLAEPVKRVTPDMITAAIESAAYHILPGSQITICELTLRNGTKVLGHNYGSIDPAKQDWLEGRRAAHDMAVEKVWELEGYALRERLRTVADTKTAFNLDAAVSRFLAWPLPKDFSPDCGISFDGRKDDEWNKNKTWPIGTNLLTAEQTRKMLEHVLVSAGSVP